MEKLFDSGAFILIFYVFLFLCMYVFLFQRSDINRLEKENERIRKDIHQIEIDLIRGKYERK